MTIMTQAKRLFVMLKENAGPYYDVEITACSEWFKRLKKFCSLHTLKVSRQSASANAKESEEFLETLDNLILEENYRICWRNLRTFFLFWPLKNRGA